MRVTIKGRFVGLGKKETQDRTYYDVSILQDGGLGTERISISPEMAAGIDGIDELTPLTIEASAWAHCKNDRAWINWRAEGLSLG